jgi:hypothetical protein
LSKLLYFSVTQGYEENNISCASQGVIRNTRHQVPHSISSAGLTVGAAPAVSLALGGNNHPLSKYPNIVFPMHKGILAIMRIASQ